MITRSGSVGSGNHQNPKIFPQIMLMFAHNFPQPASDTIAKNRTAEPPARNKARARRTGILRGENAKQHESTAFRPPVLLYTIELRSAR